MAGAAMGIVAFFVAACGSPPVATLGESLGSVESIFADHGVGHCFDTYTDEPPLVEKSLQKLSPDEYSESCVEGSETPSSIDSEISAPFNLEIVGPLGTKKVSFVSIESNMGTYMYGSGVAQYESRAPVPQVDSLMLATAQALAPSAVAWLRSILPSDVTSPVSTSVTANKRFGPVKLGFSTAPGPQQEDVFLWIETKDYVAITNP
jgi:hypothetical protein